MSFNFTMAKLKIQIPPLFPCSSQMIGLLIWKRRYPEHLSIKFCNTGALLKLLKIGIISKIFSPLNIFRTQKDFNGSNLCYIQIMDNKGKESKVRICLCSRWSRKRRFHESIQFFYEHRRGRADKTNVPPEIVMKFYVTYKETHKDTQLNISAYINNDRPMRQLSHRVNTKMYIRLKKTMYSNIMSVDVTDCCELYVLRISSFVCIMCTLPIEMFSPDGIPSNDRSILERWATAIILFWIKLISCWYFSYSNVMKRIVSEVPTYSSIRSVYILHFEILLQVYSYYIVFAPSSKCKNKNYI